jgi:hypothetical protein
MTNVCKEFAEFELRKLTGDAGAELEAECSISHCQGDHVTYKGNLDCEGLVSAITTILSQDENSNKRTNNKLLALANNWFGRLDGVMECNVNNFSTSSNNWYFNEDFVDLLPSDEDCTAGDIDSVLTEEVRKNIEKELDSIRDLIADKIQEAAKSAYSTLSNLILNLYPDDTLKRSYKTKNFVVEIHEMQVEDVDGLFGYEMGGIDYDEYLHEAAKKIATGENRAFELVVKVFVVVDGEMQEIGSNCVEGIIEDAKAKPGGHLLREVASEAISQARSYLKSIRSIAA